MHRAFDFLIILLVINVLMAVLGFDTTSNVLMSRLGISIGESGGSGFNAGSFWEDLFTGITLLGTVVTVVVGLLTRDSKITFGVAFSTLLATFIGDFVGIVTELNTAGYPSWINYTIQIIMYPIIIGYAFSIAEWFGET